MMVFRLPRVHVAHTLGASAALLVASAVSAEPWIPQALSGENASWLAQHRRNVQRARAGHIDVLFLGDSIFERWSSIGKASWDASFAGLRVANFAVSGDRTQHLLWRMLHGELDRFEPNVCFILIGTNNIPSDAPGSVARGVSAVVQIARERFPHTKIVLFGMLPRGPVAEGSIQPKVDAVGIRSRGRWPAGIDPVRDDNNLGGIDTARKEQPPISRRVHDKGRSLMVRTPFQPPQHSEHDRITRKPEVDEGLRVDVLHVHHQ